MNSQQKIVNLITICRRSGNIIMGFDAVKEAVFEGNASCVLVTPDISPKTLKEVKFFCGNSKLNVIEIGVESTELFDLLGKETVVLAVCTRGFADRFTTLGKLLNKVSEEKK